MKKLKKQTNDTTIKCIRNLFRLKKEIKYRILRDIRKNEEHEEGDYYKPLGVGNFLCCNYSEYKSKDNTKTSTKTKITP